LKEPLHAARAADLAYPGAQAHRPLRLALHRAAPLVASREAAGRLRRGRQAGSYGCGHEQSLNIVRILSPTFRVTGSISDMPKPAEAVTRGKLGHDVSEGRLRIKTSPYAGDQITWSEKVSMAVESRYGQRDP